VNTPFRSPAARSAAAVATALAVGLLSGATLTASAADQRTGTGAWSPTDAAGQHARFVDKHGSVLSSPQLYLIYWGTLWRPYTAAEPTAAQVTAAVHTLLDSAYLTGLTQYRSSGHGTLRGSTLVASSDPPDGFTDDQVVRFLDAQLTAGAVPGPDPDNQTVYGVVMPTGITADVARRAEHDSYTRYGEPIHFAWFTNVGDLDSITALVSHELVEAATDPDGGEFLGLKGTCDEPGWCEIADVCESLSILDGVTVQAYWSNQHNACIVPGSAAPQHPSESGEAPGDPSASAGRTRVGTGNPPGPGHTQMETP
jgi:hypothetical protein